MEAVTAQGGRSAERASRNAVFVCGKGMRAQPDSRKSPAHLDAGGYIRKAQSQGAARMLP